jgi:hypothetical protein
MHVVDDRRRSHSAGMQRGTGEVKSHAWQHTGSARFPEPEGGGPFPDHLRQVAEFAVKAAVACSSKIGWSEGHVASTGYREVCGPIID